MVFAIFYVTPMNSGIKFSPRKRSCKMTNFTNIIGIAAMAVILAIGFSLNACEEKEKASKPTEAADLAASKALAGEWREIANVPKYLMLREKDGELDGGFPFSYSIKGDTIIATRSNGEIHKINFKIKDDVLTLSSNNDTPYIGEYERYQRHKPTKPDSKSETLTKSNAKAIVGKWIRSGSNILAEFEACLYNEKDGICSGEYTEEGGNYLYAIKGDLILTGSEMIDYNDFNPNDKIVFKGDKMTLGSDTYERAK
jgi:hypothetical protein